MVPCCLQSVETQCQYCYRSFTLNGCEYSCEFHVTQGLAYDAIIGRDFLQENRALIDLDNSSITFKGAGHLGKQFISSTTVPVMGTFLPKQNLNKKKTVATQTRLWSPIAY